MNEQLIPENEVERHAKLLSYEILGSLPEQQYDDLTQLASYICQSKISLISLIDKDRQWFKSRVGLDAEETPRDVAFCAHAIDGDDLFYVPDATADERFADNPLVTGEPNVVFYAGAPLVTPDGFRLGTLCVIDDHPRQLTDDQKNALVRLSRQVVNNFELRLQCLNLQARGEEIALRNEELQQFAYRTSHDLRAPITTAKGLAAYLVEDVEAGELSQAMEDGRRIHRLMENSENLITDIVSLVRADVSSEDLQAVNIADVLNASCERLEDFAQESGCVLRTTNTCIGDVFLERGRLAQILDNLISNGIKYSDPCKTESHVYVDVSSNTDVIAIAVEDNGVGIPNEFQKDMYKMFRRSHSDSTGSGLGLAIVKRHVDYLQGSIECASSEQGTVFKVSLPHAHKGRSDAT